MKPSLALLLFSLAAIGCEPSPPAPAANPTANYADLVTIYESEQAEFDRLMEKRNASPEQKAIADKLTGRILEIDKESGTPQELEARREAARQVSIEEVNATELGKQVLEQRKRVEAAKAAKEAAAPK